MANKVKIDPALLTALKSAAHMLSISASALTTQSKTYEVWITFETARGFELAGAAVMAFDHRNAPAKVFNVRGGPGKIPPISSQATDAPCHFGIQWEDKFLELHISLQHESAHGNLHELDLSVVDHVHAQTLRNNSVPSAYSGIRLAGAELKAYAVTTKLDLNIARALTGLALDLDPAVIAPSVQFQSRSGHVLLAGHFIAPQYFLITSAQFRSSSVKLLCTYGIKPVASVLPHSPAAHNAVNTIVADVKQRLQFI